MRLTGAWIEAAHVQRVLAMLAAGGHLAFLVGGCVRNAALGTAVSDIDIATDARPEQVVALAEAAGLRAVPTGIEHGTVTVIADHEPHEITTFRRDIETFGRHATVAFSTRIEEDAARRDFTMNALYARADGTVLDPLGEGLADLAARRLRFVGDPGQRIREDYLRILRFFRFTAWYGAPEEGFDAEGLAACAMLAEGIERLSRERVGHEMRKLLGAPDPAPAVAAMATTGILPHVLPGADPAALAPLVHLEAGQPADPIRRLAVLGGTDPAERLRLSKPEARRLERLREGALSGAGPAVLGYRLGARDGLDAVLLQAALTGTPLAETSRNRVDFGAAQRFPVQAADLMPALQGAALGARLKELEARWIGSGFALDRAALLG
ncbi:CCA tRNA nucleotidyltransferase [Sinirhodobacter huangdaonensis]|uniref:CCA tRNA nucleotidyltransferase n=1 Tax=Paenirhodobacter huangdaonensis TaxID=2501515 RepID=A0A3S3MA37_9RHOB|nr:CCA tRNA nucleotidyltransferase [Sinirhodobacter huangdaonensis]RWR52729.1 CCA tRNA nucleotidyltransferase [Sinirhodobacter huangdaonensis]